MNSVNFTKCLELLKSLQCRDAAEVWKNFSDRPEGFGDMGIEDVLEVMLTAEKNGRDRRHQETLLRLARIPLRAMLSQIVSNEGRDATFQKTLLTLSSLDFIRSGRNVTIFGGTGTGKSYIASALLRESCLHGMGGRFYTASDLTALLQELKGTPAYKTRRQSLLRLCVLVLDDFCLTEYSADELEALYDILNDRYGKKTVIVTSQKSPDIWLENLGKTTLAESVVERLSTNNYTLLLKGKSLRHTLDLNEETSVSAY